MTVEPLPMDDKPDSVIDLPSTSKHNWKSADIRDAWGIEPGNNILADTFKAAVRNPEHPRHGYIDRIPHESAFEEMQKISSKSLQVSEISKAENSVLVAVTKSEATARQLINAFEDNDYDEMAHIFGHPSCCTRHTSEWRNKGIHDPVYETACNTPSAEPRDDRSVIEVSDPHPILNVFWSYLGWQFIDFYPCSFECDTARSIAIKNGKLMREIGVGETAEELFEFLSEPASWSGYNGLTHVKNSHCIGSYDCDNRWDERRVVWIDDHDAKASC